VAATAGQLMRSRYSAYVLRDEAYLQMSWHPNARPNEPLTDADTKWLGLEVRAETENGGSATVEFVARCRVNGRGQRMHEVSRFTREAGQWFYVDGSFPEK
jgi:SEC-C motif-containing protein